MLESTYHCWFEEVQEIKEFRGKGVERRKEKEERKKRKRQIASHITLEVSESQWELAKNRGSRQLAGNFHEKAFFFHSLT